MSLSHQQLFLQSALRAGGRPSDLAVLLTRHAVDLGQDDQLAFTAALIMELTTRIASGQRRTVVGQSLIGAARAL